MLEQGEIDLTQGLVGDNWGTRGCRSTPDGLAHPLKTDDVNIRVEDHWDSPDGLVRYPSRWRRNRWRPLLGSSQMGKRPCVHRLANIEGSLRLAEFVHGQDRDRVSEQDHLFDVSFKV